MLGLPGLGEPAHRGGRQARPRAEELAQGGGEVSRRQAPQVEQGQDLGDLGRFAHVDGQDGRAVVLSFPAVVDARCLHLDHPGAGHDLSLFGVAVADHEPFARLVDDLGVSVEVSPAFGQQGGGQHLARGQAAQLVQVDGCGVILHPRGGVVY